MEENFELENIHLNILTGSFSILLRKKKDTFGGQKTDGGNYFLSKEQYRNPDTQNAMLSYRFVLFGCPAVE